MSLSLAAEMQLIAELAEVKRIYHALEAALLKTTPAVLLITSAAAGEGKTRIAAGLAVIAARQSGKRVLAVDLNWHVPFLHVCFALDRLFDREALKANGAASSLARPSGIQGLDILTAPKACEDIDDTQGVVSALGAEILRTEREAYDIVIADASSVFPANRHMVDPVVASTRADGVALVVLANVTPRQMVMRALTALQAAGARVAGTIVNQWKNPMA